ncbi:MAG TPA: terminase small subunit [Clostridia bacterium]
MIDPTQPLTFEEKKEEKEKELTTQQEIFCQLYATDMEFFGNGVQSYIKAYDIDVNKKGAYNGARASASRLLADANILARINKILESGGFNDANIDKQLEFLINQSADLNTKLGAIREYNRLKARIIDKVDVTGEIKTITIKRTSTKKQGNE